MEDLVLDFFGLKKNISKNYHLKFLLIFILLFTHISFTEENPRYLINFSSKIHLVILGSGTQTIINSRYYLDPDKVEVNGIVKESCKKPCEFEYSENNVTLYFNAKVTSGQSMFYQRDNIKEIDLSDFDFSGVTTTVNMFRECYSLEKINFGNINTSSLNCLDKTFLNCTRLTSLDISNFDTSKVTSFIHTFSYCSSLLTLNLGNMNTTLATTFQDIFAHCEKLESIDI